jgi:hypothetical protein
LKKIFQTKGFDLRYIGIGWFLKIIFILRNFS